jgi:hypothetical protein
MKKIVCFLVTGLIIGSLGVESAKAQSCTDELGEGLKYCIEQGVASCASSVKECEPKDYAVTLEDVWNDSITQCCKRQNKKARKACLLSFSRRLGTKGRVRSLQSFLRSAKKNTRDLIKNDCYSGAYSNLF